MKTTRYIGLVLLSAMMLLTGCRDYLTEIEPGKTMLDDYYTSPDAAIQNVTGCYVPLMWEYGNTYFPEWFIGDVVSDDALKGGGTGRGAVRHRRQAASLSRCCGCGYG